MPNRRSSQDRRHCTLYIVSASVCSVKPRHGHPVRHEKHPNQIIQTRHTFTTKLRGRPFVSGGGGGGGLAVNVESESFAGDNIYFHQTSAQTIYFKI